MHVQLNDEERIRILNCNDVFKIMHTVLERENKIERHKSHLWVISLEENNRVLNIELIAMGQKVLDDLKPADIYSISLQKLARKIIIVQNRADGHLLPDENDEDQTDRLIQVGELIRVPIFDHLIINDKSHFSFSANGLMEKLVRNSKYRLPFEEMEKLEQEILESGHTAGLEEGIAQGLKDGQKMKAIAIVKAMLKNGMAVPVIASITGLTETEVKSLKTQ